VPSPPNLHVPQSSRLVQGKVPSSWTRHVVSAPLLLHVPFPLLPLPSSSYSTCSSFSLSGSVVIHFPSLKFTVSSPEASRSDTHDSTSRRHSGGWSLVHLVHLSYSPPPSSTMRLENSTDVHFGMTFDVPQSGFTGGGTSTSRHWGTMLFRYGPARYCIVEDENYVASNATFRHQGIPCFLLGLLKVSTPYPPDRLRT
jgi:hypothetical protein